MRGYTHALLGVTGAVALHAVYPYLPSSLPQLPIAILCAGVGALLPDIDSDESLIRQETHTARSAGMHGQIISMLMPSHRGLTHSGLAVVAVLCVLWLYPRYWLMAFAVGYLSHLFADMLTRQGVPVLWPFRGRLSLLPLTTGGAGEYLIGLGAAVWLALYLIPASALTFAAGLWRQLVEFVGGYL